MIQQRLLKFATPLVPILILASWLVMNLTRAQSPQIFGGVIPQAGTSLSQLLPDADVVLLDASNRLWVRQVCSSKSRRIVVSGLTGQLIGIDYRPADGLLYGIDDAGVIYTIDTTSGSATQVSTLTIPFGGDIRSLLDFNPVVSAIRLIGANDSNYAVVNSNGGNLNLTVAQKPITYAPGDLNEGKNPNLGGGAYTNNVAGATTTIFYGIDYSLGTLVTIAPPLVGAGSSNTGGGQLQTIGTLMKGNRPFDLDVTADFDIYTFDGVNRLLGINDDRIFTIDLSQIQGLPLGQTQPVYVRSLPFSGDARFIDLAVGSAQQCAQSSR